MTVLGGILAGVALVVLVCVLVWLAVSVCRPDPAPDEPATLESGRR